MITKREWSAPDVHGQIIYAKRNGDDTFVYPVLVSNFGGFLVNNGLSIPLHDQRVIDEADPNNVIITYKLSGVSVATKTIVVSGTTTTITVTAI